MNPCFDVLASRVNITKPSPYRRTGTMVLTANIPLSTGRETINITRNVNIERYSTLILENHRSRVMRVICLRPVNRVTWHWFHLVIIGMSLAPQSSNRFEPRKLPRYTIEAQSSIIHWLLRLARSLNTMFSYHQIYLAGFDSFVLLSMQCKDNMTGQWILQCALTINGSSYCGQSCIVI